MITLRNVLDKLGLADIPARSNQDQVEWAKEHFLKVHLTRQDGGAILHLSVAAPGITVKLYFSPADQLTHFSASYLGSKEATRENIERWAQRSRQPHVKYVAEILNKALNDIEPSL